MTYGALYNYRVVHSKIITDPQIAPKGWHVPTDEDWNVLIAYLGGTTVAGGKLKSKGTLEAGTGLWVSPNTGATNESGFSGFPGGQCSDLNSFSSFHGGLKGYWWSSTYTQMNPSNFTLDNSNTNVINENFSTFNSDFMSIRCIKD
jgi:uncharacterized protein (TIGR02145 family)